MFCPVYAQETYYKVLKVVDGDTFFVDFDREHTEKSKNEKHLLKHNVQIEYSAKSKKDYYGRHLVSIYYDCNKNGDCKSYEEEILKAGYAFIYKYSNHRKLLKPFLDTDKIYKNAEKT